MNTLDRVCTSFLRAVLLRMKELKLNRTALARRMNVSRAYITKVLNGGEVNYSFATALRFAHALQMDFTPQLTLFVADENEARNMKHEA